MLSRKIIIPVAIATIGGAAIFGIGQVFAQTTSNNPMSGLAQMIAQKFNLNQSDVQAVFDQFHSQQKANIQQKMQQLEDQRLTTLVTQGKITAQQKTAIENELNNLKSKYNLGNFNGQTFAQRKQALQSFQTDWQTWARSQGIDPTILKMGPGFGIGRHGWGRGMPKPSSSPSAT